MIFGLFMIQVKNKAQIEKIKAELGNMTYIPLSIKSFESDTTFLKKNKVFNGIVNFVWTVDGNVKSQKIFCRFPK